MEQLGEDGLFNCYELLYLSRTNSLCTCGPSGNCCRKGGGSFTSRLRHPLMFCPCGEPMSPMGTPTPAIGWFPPAHPVLRLSMASSTPFWLLRIMYWCILG